MIEYDGYLDRSRLGPLVFSEGSLYSKRFFSDFKKVILKGKKEDSEILSLNYQFTHEYKKFEYQDPQGSSVFGDFVGEKLILDRQRFLKKEHEIFTKIDLKKVAHYQLKVLQKLTIRI